jgi:hypothetical protein
MWVDRYGNKVFLKWEYQSKSNGKEYCMYLGSGWTNDKLKAIQRAGTCEYYCSMLEEGELIGELYT